MEPGTKVAVISKSGEGAPAEKAASQPPPAEEKDSTEKKLPKAEAAPAVKEKTLSPPQPAVTRPSATPKTMASEPQLPPKDRERRVRFRLLFDRERQVLTIWLMLW